MPYYVLEGKIPKKVHILQWGRWFERTRDRIVKQDDIGEIKVSTVFLGLDHNFADQGPPLLFETMIFGGPCDEYQTRCSTWEQAEEMHKEAVHLARRSLLKVIPPDPPEI